MEKIDKILEKLEKIEDRLSNLEEGEKDVKMGGYSYDNFDDYNNDCDDCCCEKNRTIEKRKKNLIRDTNYSDEEELTNKELVEDGLYVIKEQIYDLEELHLQSEEKVKELKGSIITIESLIKE